MVAKASAKPKAATAATLGIADLAKVMKVKPATARVKLRNAKITKPGKSYSWKTQAELKKVADKLVVA